MTPNNHKHSNPDETTGEEMRERIPATQRDELFFYASEIRGVPESDEWHIQIDPEDCLTGYSDVVNEDPQLGEISDRSLTVREEADAKVYRGPILISAGVVLCVGDRFVLFERDADAPVAPLKWTSPAGRCDTTPIRTALGELYEELLISADGRPAVVSPPNREPITDVYDETLRSNGVTAEPDEWIRIDATEPDQFADLQATVTTEYGDERHRSRFWPYLDETNSTLELRKIYRVETPENSRSLRFEDAEFDRRTGVLTKSEFLAMDDDDLVPTDRAFRDRLRDTS